MTSKNRGLNNIVLRFFLKIVQLHPATEINLDQQSEFVASQLVNKSKSVLFYSVIVSLYCLYLLYPSSPPSFCSLFHVQVLCQLVNG